VSANDTAEIAQQFCAAESLSFPVLVDPDRSLRDGFGTHSAITGTKRVTFVIDTSGRIDSRFTHFLRMGAHSRNALGAITRLNSSAD
jgi:peroxiredoxin